MKTAATIDVTVPERQQSPFPTRARIHHAYNVLSYIPEEWPSGLRQRF